MTEKSGLITDRFGQLHRLLHAHIFRNVCNQLLDRIHSYELEHLGLYGRLRVGDIGIHLL